MDFDDTREEAAFRAEAAAFLSEHAPREGLGFGVTALAQRIELQRTFQRVLHEHGWSVPSWPRAWGGRALTPAQAVIWRQECARASVGESVLSGGLAMLGPTLIAHGSDEQKRRFLEPTARGDIMWAQLFSEPAAGSDLAALATRAERGDGAWRVSGQKVWSSFADFAEMGFLLARTDPQKPKHHGISYLLIDLKQAGVEVRPLVEMTGGRHFNEVFLNDARVPFENLVGEEGAGWGIARTTLMFERGAIGAFSALEQFEKLAALLRARGIVPDAATAGELARLYTRARALDLLNKRVLTKISHGGVPGAEASVMKNEVADVMLTAAELGMRLLGAEALAASHLYARDFLFAPSMHIAGGAEEVMKNLIAEQVLGLPREPDAKRGQPFHETTRSRA